MNEKCKYCECYNCRKHNECFECYSCRNNANFTESNKTKCQDRQVQMNPYTAKTQRCVVHRSRFDSWCNQEGVSSTLAAAKIVNNFNPQN